MSLRIEQNWKWSNKTFPHTLCVVSTSDETTFCGICLTLNKNLHRGIGVAQAWCGWRLIYANYYPQYNLAGKSNSTFSSKINRFHGIINR